MERFCNHVKITSLKFEVNRLNTVGGDRFLMKLNLPKNQQELKKTIPFGQDDKFSELVKTNGQGKTTKPKCNGCIQKTTILLTLLTNY